MTIPHRLSASSFRWLPSSHRCLTSSHIISALLWNRSHPPLLCLLLILRPTIFQLVHLAPLSRHLQDTLSAVCILPIAYLLAVWWEYACSSALHMKWHDSHMAVISLHQNSFLCSKSVGCTWLIQCIEQGKCCKSSGQEFCCPLNDAICCDASYCCPQSYPYCSKGECTNSYSESVAQFVEVTDHYLLMSVWLAWAQQIYRVVLLVSHIAYYLLLKLSSFFQISTVSDRLTIANSNKQSVGQSVSCWVILSLTPIQH